MKRKRLRRRGRHVKGGRESPLRSREGVGT